MTIDSIQFDHIYVSINGYAINKNDFGDADVEVTIAIVVVKGKILTVAKKEIGRRELNNLIEQLAEAVKPPSTKRRHFYFEFAQAMLEVPLEAVDDASYLYNVLAITYPVKIFYNNIPIQSHRIA